MRTVTSCLTLSLLISSLTSVRSHQQQDAQKQALHAIDRYSGYRVYRLDRLRDMTAVDAVLSIREKLEDERLRKIVIFDEIIIPGRRYIKFIVCEEESEVVEQQLARANISYDISSNDVAKVLNENHDINERQKSRYNAAVVKHGPLIAPLVFLDYGAIVEMLKAWAAAAGDDVETFSLGQTAENRETIGVTINAKREHLPAIWVDAGIDPRVWMTTAAALHLANKIMLDKDDQVAELRDKYRWFIVPTVNPDGYHHAMTEDRFWRKTRTSYVDGCHGADINRNFNYSWAGAGTTPDPCSDRHRGASQFSELESRNLRDALERCNQTSGGLLIYVSLQTYGQYLMAPWAGRDLRKPADYEYLWTVAEDALRAVNKLKVRVGNLDEKFKFGTAPSLRYPVSGSVLDWVRSRLGVKWTYSFDVGPGEDSLRHPLEMSVPPTGVRASAQQLVALVTSLVDAVEAGPTVDLVKLHARVEPETLPTFGDRRDEL